MPSRGIPSGGVQQWLSVHWSAYRQALHAILINFLQHL
jgi:hypothetical protein